MKEYSLGRWRETMALLQPAVNKNIQFTYNDYLIYPANGKQLQLIEGDFYMTPAPRTYHQDVSRNLEFLLHCHVSENDLGKIYDAPTDVVLSGSDVVQPDILFVSKSRLHIIKKDNIKGAPDLVVEILSPNTQKMDMDVKRKLYAKYGVKEYWIVDPDKKTVEMLHLGESRYKISKKYRAGTLQSKVLPGLKIHILDIFTK